MGDIAARIWRFPFYLWLLGLYPILHLYSENLGLVKDDEVVIALAVALAATTFAYLATNSFIRQRHKTAALLGICSLAFSLSGHLYQIVFRGESLLSWTATVLLLTVMALDLVRRHASPSACRGTTGVGNLILSALTIFSLVAMAPELARVSSLAEPTSWDGTAFAERETSPKLMDSPERPDIYYIIPDGYPSDSWLLEAMNYDNSAFTGDLEARGFVIAPHAQSNYGATLLSLASVTNMRYFAANDAGMNDLDYLRLAFADSLVARQLLARGYTFAHLLSGFSIPSPIADINRDFSAGGTIDIAVGQGNFQGEVTRQAQGDLLETLDLAYFYKQSFFALYIDTTLLRIAAAELGELPRQDDYAPYPWHAPTRYLDTLANLETIAAMPESTFAIVHLLKPHEPVVFDAGGKFIGPIWDPSPEKFFAEFEYVNNQFLRAFDAILDGSDTPPVIIFQGDHGSTYGDIGGANDRDTHFDVYAAYHLPAGIELDIPQPYTLVNAFPLVFNAVFGTNYPLLEDRLFEAVAGYDAPFEQADVTDDFAHP